jgi:protein-arginine kinase activator protein McsA
VICHDPHTGVVQLRQAGEQTTRTTCANCHYEQAQVQNVAVHSAMQMTCETCHMPRLVKTAWGDAAKFTGDIRTHLMAIDSTLVATLDAEGKLTSGQIGLDWACRNCHTPDSEMAKTDEELLGGAAGYHTPKP